MAEDWKAKRNRIRESLAEDLSKLEGEVTVAIIDIDNFKDVNDTHGHDLGDRVLEVVQDALQKGTADGARVIRTGGDEFALVLPGQPPEASLIHLDAVRRKLAGKKVGPVRVSISGGIASYPQHVQEPSQLLEAADDAIAKSKAQGKGRVSIYVEEKMVLKTTYYSRAQLSRLSALADKRGSSEAAILRDALDEYLERFRDAV